jgi:hypothetical protein
MAPEASAATGGETFAGAPNMLGHLLFGSRSINFRYNRAAGPINVANPGATSLLNAAVADNNSPLPRDRVGFRFNFFSDAQQVTGFGPPVFNEQGIGTAFAETRSYDVKSYTFNFEKTFLDQRASLELRVPFSTGLSTHLDLSAGTIVGPDDGGAFDVVSTPQNTLGREGTQFGNMTLIAKGLAYQSCSVALSGGVALGIPTGDDTAVNIVDYSGPAVQGIATVQRLRQIEINNQTWSLSPFLAFLVTPTERFFTQGFVQFDFPLNTSSIFYKESTPRGSLPPVSALERAGLVSYPTLDTPFAVKSGISEQALMQLNWGTGFWLMRDPCRTWVTGIAPTVELHYVTTLQNASIVTLPADTLLQLDSNTGRAVQEQPPRVGNLNNRVDILDLTVGSTILVSDSLMLATGFSFPLHRSTDRTFDWEFQLQLNYYFGGLGSRPTPNF